MRQEQIRGWTFKLIDFYRKTCLDSKVPMKLPLISVVDLRDDLLGLWDNEKKEISISLKLLQEAPLSRIYDVLKHEMAHQFVDEVLCRTDSRPHGELFQEACKILGASPEATYKYNQQIDRQLLKIEKLLALSTSMNQHEAEAALAKAQELSFKYNVSLSSKSTQEYQVRPLGDIRKRIPVYEWKVMNILNDYYFVKSLKIFHSDDYAQETLWQFEIYGTKHNIDTAEYVYYFLLNNAEALWKEYRQSQGKSVSRMRNSYMNGLFDGFSQKLSREQELLKEKYAVVRIIDIELENFFHECNPRISRRKISSNTNRSVYSDGIKEGRQLNVKHGIKKQSSGQEGLFLTDGRAP